jgi:bacterioferritin
MDRAAILAQLNLLLRLELEGVNRYLHHSFMVFGIHRSPVVAYFRTQATESLTHATLLGEKIVSLGGHPNVRIEASWEPEHHEVEEMLEINLEAEERAVEEYVKLLKMVPTEEVALEDLARQFVREEQEHVEDLRKYLRDAHGPAASPAAEKKPTRRKR